MKKIDILKEYITNNNGLLLTSDAVKLNIHKQYIKLLCDEKYLIKLENGVYVKTGKTVNEFFLLQQRYKKGVFSHNTALYFYHLTDRTPIKIDLTFPSNIRVKNELIKSHYIKAEDYNIGINTINMNDGTKINVYDIERTIIDIIRDRNKIDTQIFNTAIKEYVKLKNKNLVKLSKYAREFKVEKILKQYMEVIL